MMAISRSRGLSMTARGDHAGGVAAQPHAHGEGLFAVGAGPPEQAVEVERHPGQVTEVFQQREQREEDSHRGQHHADHPGGRQVDAVDQDAGEPPRHADRRGARLQRGGGSCRGAGWPSIADGTLAPAMVSQRTPASSRIITGNPAQRLVRMRSRVRSSDGPSTPSAVLDDKIGQLGRPGEDALYQRLVEARPDLPP